MCDSVPLHNVYARVLVWSMFRDSADEDYLFARWAARISSPYMFFWHAQQAIEKYLKGALLLNDRRISNFNHDLRDLFAEVMIFANDLLPALICPPKYWPQDRRITPLPYEPMVDFIGRINDGGKTSNRYRHDGYTHYGNDLHKLDEVCFQFRRLVFPLDASFSPIYSSYRETIKRNPNYQPHESFEFLNKGNVDQKLTKRETLMWKNFSFFESHALEDGKVNSGIYYSMSDLELNIYDKNRGDEAVSWLLRQGRFSKSERAEIHSLLNSTYEMQLSP